MQPWVFQTFVLFISDTAAENDFEIIDATALLRNNSGCFKIVIVDDSDPELAENFTISFVVNRTQPEGVNISINQSEAVITIEENHRKSHWFEMIGLRNYMCVQLQTYSVCTVLHHTDIKFGIT